MTTATVAVVTTTKVGLSPTRFKTGHAPLTPALNLLRAAMPLFDCVEENGPQKRRVGEDRRVLTGGKGKVLTPEELQQTVEWLEHTTVTMGQLAIIHDTRIRELETLINTVQIPVKNAYAEALNKTDKGWKDKRKSMYERKQTGTGAEQIGSKHLQLGAVLLQSIYEDTQTQQETKRLLAERWHGAKTDTPDFLEGDIRICKWRLARDEKSGILDFKLADDLQQVEKEIIRVLVHSGAKVKHGAGPRQTKVRELEEAMQGTWGGKGGSSNGR